MAVSIIQRSGPDQYRNGGSRSAPSVALVGTYLPRQCGIATFTHDLYDALAGARPGAITRAVALNDVPTGYDYPPEVAIQIDDGNPADYALAARALNHAGVDVISLQHEFGIFGGTSGRYVTDLISGLEAPVVTTLHTVLKEPSLAQRSVMREIGALSERLVVMSEIGRNFLRDVYKIPLEKIVVIPHGVPDKPLAAPDVLKAKLGLTGRRIVLTFGLLSPNKGIEVMLEAMALIARQDPDALYLVLGAAHPHVRAANGGPYADHLKKVAAALGLGRNVQFEDRFVEPDELCDYLGAADVYVTPYLNEAQIVSGTLSYAMSRGKAVVSTPYWYAQEVLAQGRGCLVPFGDPEALANQVSALLRDERERRVIGQRAHEFTRGAVWPAVGRRYFDVFDEVQEHRQAIAGGPLRWAQ